jgi:hypothetical protein
MSTSIKRTKSNVGYSQFPLKLSLPPKPEWRRREPSPGPGTGQIERSGPRLHIVQPGSAP